MSVNPPSPEPSDHSSQVNIGDVQEGIHGSTIAGHDVIQNTQLLCFDR